MCAPYKRNINDNSSIVKNKRINERMNEQTKEHTKEILHADSSGSVSKNI